MNRIYKWNYSKTLIFASVSLLKRKMSSKKRSINKITLKSNRVEILRKKKERNSKPKSFISSSSGWISICWATVKCRVPTVAFTKMAKACWHQGIFNLEGWYINIYNLLLRTKNSGCFCPGKFYLLHCLFYQNN